MLCEGASSPASTIWDAAAASATTSSTRRSRASPPPLGRLRASLAALLQGAARSRPTLDSAGRVLVPHELLDRMRGSAKEVTLVGAGECIEIWDREAWSAKAGELDTAVPNITAIARTARNERADERAEHVPSTRRGAARAARPAAGRDGRRRDLRRRRSRAARRRAARSRRPARRDRPRPRRARALRALRRRRAVPHALRRRAVRDRARGSSPTRACQRDVVYLDLGVSSMQIDTAGARLLVRRRRAARHAHGPDVGAERGRPARDVGRAPAGARAARVRRGALRAPDRARDRARARRGADRDHDRSSST